MRKYKSNHITPISPKNYPLPNIKKNEDELLELPEWIKIMLNCWLPKQKDSEVWTYITKWIIKILGIKNKMKSESNRRNIINYLID